MLSLTDRNFEEPQTGDKAEGARKRHQRLLAAIEDRGVDWIDQATIDDRDRTYPDTNMQSAKSLGLHLLAAPEEIGGFGYWAPGSMVAWCEALSRIARWDCSLAHLLMVHGHAVGIIATHGSSQQRSELEASLAAGELFSTLGSEASIDDSLPDRLAMLLHPARDGHTLSGVKGFGSGVTGAARFLVWAAKPGSSAFGERLQFAVVKADAPGLKIVDNWHVLGMRATMSCEVSFDAVPVKKDQVVGAPGAWVSLDHRKFTLSYTAQHVGLAEGALKCIRSCVDAADNVSDTTLTRLGHLSALLFGARSALAIAAAEADRELSDQSERLATKALHLAKAAALEICSDGFELVGARATHDRFPLGRLLRDVRTLSLQGSDARYLLAMGREMLSPECEGEGDGA